MRKATVFEFVDRTIDPESGRLVFSYAVQFDDKSIETFIEAVDLGGVYRVKQLPEEFLTNILEDLHLILGISYYKLFCPSNLSLDIKRVPSWKSPCVSKPSGRMSPCLSKIAKVSPCLSTLEATSATEELARM